MQRIESLIEKLKEQYLANAPASQLLMTIQMLQNEVLSGIKETDVLGAAQIAVVMPNVHNIVMDEPVKKEEAKDTDAEKVYYKLDISDEDLMEDDEVLEENEATETIDSVDELKKEEPEEVQQPDIQKQPLPFQVELIFDKYKKDTYDPLSEVPTLSQQLLNEENTTVHDRIASGNQMHTESNRIKDLKKAISINDKFMFINELFRGDEAMYERSIKTINNFHIYAEAEYWIKRELKTKIGWPVDSPTVEYFDSLVKRRFC